MTLLDLTIVTWLAATAVVVYVGLPFAVRRLCRADGLPTIPLVAGLLVWTVVGMTGLSVLSLVNPATVLVLHAAYALSVFAESHRCFDDGTERLLRAAAALRSRVPVHTRPDPRVVLAHLRAAARAAVPLPESASRPHRFALATLIAVGVAARLWPVLAEARLFDPFGYEELFLVRRIIDGPWPGGLTPAGPAWIAALSTLSAIDPAYVVRFLPALLACVVTWALPRVVLGLVHRLDAAIVAAACWFLAGSGLASELPWGSILSRQYVVVDAYVAALFLLALLAQAHRQGAGAGDCLVTACAVAVFSPPLGIVAVGALVSPPKIRTIVVASTWLGIAVAGLSLDAPAALRNVAATMPVAVALAAALVCAAVPRRIYLPERSSAVACGALIAFGGFSVMPSSQPIEHDEMARQVLRIVRQSPPGETTIVAGDVPLLYGESGSRVMPIRMFVACASGALLPECVAAQRTTTYVIVQKRPFDVAGLAAEQASLSAAERLVHATKGSHIDHEDGIVRVYVVPPQRWSR